MRKINKHAFVELFVGRMKPINMGTYTRNEVNREYKKKEKIFVR